MPEPRTYPNKPITNDRLDYIQDCAKATARRAIDTGDTSELTPLSRAYYEVFLNGRANSGGVAVVVNAVDKNINQIVP